jgi:hypothetical protein
LFKDNKKAFYSYVRSKQTVKIKVTQLKRKDNSLTENDIQAAEEMGNFFKSVFVEEGLGKMPHFDIPCGKVLNSQLEDIEITVQDVINKLKQLKGDK